MAVLVGHDDAALLYIIVSHRGSLNRYWLDPPYHIWRSDKRTEKHHNCAVCSLFRTAGDRGV